MSSKRRRRRRWAGERSERSSWNLKVKSDVDRIKRALPRIHPEGKKKLSIRPKRDEGRLACCHLVDTEDENRTDACWCSFHIAHVFVNSCHFIVLSCLRLIFTHEYSFRCLFRICTAFSSVSDAQLNHATFIARTDSARFVRICTAEVTLVLSCAKSAANVLYHHPMCSSSPCKSYLSTR